MRLSVILPTHNPESALLARTLAALEAQALPTTHWELLVVDNASTPALALPSTRLACRCVREPHLGLSAARAAGLRVAEGDAVVFVDDDNLLAPDFLAGALAALERWPHVGALGGRVIPEFAVEPETWMREFFPLLALRDFGDQPLVSIGRDYPEFAPVGAGLVVRRGAASSWLNRAPSPLTDRQGEALNSAGDNDLVFTVLRGGSAVAYAPELRLHHIIPSRRLDRAYLGALNRGIQRSWMQVLTHHGANPWPPIARWTVPLRQVRAAGRLRPWQSSAAWVRWQGVCGHFEGRAR